MNRWEQENADLEKLNAERALGHLPLITYQRRYTPAGELPEDVKVWARCTCNTWATDALPSEQAALDLHADHVSHYQPRTHTPRGTIYGPADEAGSQWEQQHWARS